MILMSNTKFKPKYHNSKILLSDSILNFELSNIKSPKNLVRFNSLIFDILCSILRCKNSRLCANFITTTLRLKGCFEKSS